MKRYKQYLFGVLILGLLFVTAPSEVQASGYIIAGSRSEETSITNPAMGSGTANYADSAGQLGSGAYVEILTGLGTLFIS